MGSDRSITEMELDLRLLRTLLAVSDETSMTKAAARLNLTQQAVSSQIRQLERVMGATLVARTSHGAELTPAGEVVAKRGAAMLADAELMVADARLTATGGAGRLRVAVKAGSTAHFMPAVAAAMREHAPDVEFDMVSVGGLAEEIDLLISGSADAALLWLPTGDDRLAVAEVLTERRVVALPPGHRLAGRSEVRLAELAGEPVVGPHSTLPAEVSRAWVVDPRPDGSPAPYGPEAGTPEDCLQLVAAGRGVWLAPASVSAYFRYPKLSWVPVADVTPLPLVVAWQRSRGNPLVTVFVEHCRRLAGQPERMLTDPS